MTICTTRPRVQRPAGDLYCHAWSSDLTPAEMLAAIDHAIANHLTVPEPRTPEQYLAARAAYPAYVHPWPRRAIERAGIIREARDVEDRIRAETDDADTLPYRMRRRIIATIREDAEFAGALRSLLMGRSA